MTEDLIVQSQQGNNDATISLIEKFNPLLNKYAYKLYYDDAYCDLRIDFIEFLHKIQLGTLRNTGEGILISYISTAIRSSYIKRLLALRKLHNFIPYSYLSDGEMHYLEAVSATSDTYFELELNGLDHVLTKLELTIIKMIYFLGYSVIETADFYGVSRQAINKTKKRALQKLAKWLQESIA